MKKIICLAFLLLFYANQKNTQGQTSCEVEVNQSELSPAYLINQSTN